MSSQVFAAMASGQGDRDLRWGRVCSATVLPLCTVFAGLTVGGCFDPRFDHPRCGAGGACPDGLVCLMPEATCSTVLRFDAPDDFASGDLANMTIEPRGALTPAAYTYGGLIARGLPQVRLWTAGAAPAWDATTVQPAAGAGLWRGESITTADDLRFLGRASKTQSSDPTMSIWMEGEVWLDAPESFALQASEVGFVDLAMPGTTAYQRIVLASASGATCDDPPSDGGCPATPFQAPGWYPIRIGFSGGSGGSFQFLHRVGDVMAPWEPWARNQLRARASELSGVLRTVFFLQILGGGDGDILPVTHIEDGSLLAYTEFADLPQGTRNPVNWSARYFGQIYIDQSGLYKLLITSNDGNQGRLGNAQAATSWAFSAGIETAKTTVSTVLDAGWNDLIVDYNQIKEMQNLHVQFEGPGFQLTEVPRERLRPVESADDRLAHGSDDRNTTIAGLAMPGQSVMPVAGFPGETVRSLDLSYEITSQHWDHLRVDLETPAGARVTVRDQDASLGEGDHFAQISIAPGTGAPLSGLLGGPVNGTWTLFAYDVVAGEETSTLNTAKLTLHTTAGPEKVATSASWTSPAFDIKADVATIEVSRSETRLPPGAALNVSAGTCRQPEPCEPTFAQIAPGTPLPLRSGHYLKVRVDMTSDGVHEPELGALELSYVPH